MRSCCSLTIPGALLAFTGCQFISGLSALEVGDRTSADAGSDDDTQTDDDDDARDGGGTGDDAPSDDDTGNAVIDDDPASPGDCVYDGPTPESCVLLGDAADSCGPDGDEDCCVVRCVPGGEFFRSYDGDTYTDQNGPARVSSFALDRYPVTVGRFRAFVEDGGAVQTGAPGHGQGEHPEVPGSGWDRNNDAYLPLTVTELEERIGPGCNDIGLRYDTYTSEPSAADTLPINCVDWFLAFAFCLWDGGRLPTEAEWNYAAAGGNEQRIYPWGGERADLDPSYATYGCDLSNACDTPVVPPVGTYSPKADGRWGHADLAGGLYDWTLDGIFVDDTEASLVPPYDFITPCNDCTALLPTDYRVIRGGNFFSTAAEVRVSFRAYRHAAGASFGVGIRCARNL